MKRLDVLVTAAASAAAEQRTPARLDLARFLHGARDVLPEAKGVLDLALGEAKPGQVRGVGADPAFRCQHAYGPPFD